MVLVRSGAPTPKNARDFKHGVSGGLVYAEEGDADEHRSSCKGAV